MSEVAKAFNMDGFDISDDPREIQRALSGVFERPILINVNTHRKFWHSGAGIDDENIFDRYQQQMNEIGDEAKKIHLDTKQAVEKAWQKQLEIR